MGIRSDAIRVGLIAAAALAAGEAQAEVSYRTVALSGTGWAGVAEGVRVGPLLSRPVAINGAGEIAFGTVAGGAGIDKYNDEAVWVVTPGAAGPRMIVGEGDAWAGADAGRTYGGEFRFNINRPGHVVVNGLYYEPGATAPLNKGHAIWGGSHDSIGLIAREGGAAPGTGGTFVSTHFWTQFSRSGSVAFNATTNWSWMETEPPFRFRSVDGGVWAGEIGSVMPVALDGDPAPGAGEGVTFFASSVLTPSVGAFGALSGDGTLTFSSQLAGPGVTGGNGFGLWSTTASGDLRPVVRAGDPAAPMTEAHYPSGPSAGGRHLVFASGLVDVGLWKDSGAGLELVWRKGDPAPGTSLKFLSLTDQLVNANGALAFVAQVSGAGARLNDTGVWAGEPGAYRLLARNGDVPPGVTDGAVFESLSLLGMNGRGQVAIMAELRRSGDFNSHTALFLSDEAGLLHLVAREGKALDLGGGESGVVSNLDFSPDPLGPIEASGGDDGNAMVLNDAGEFVFGAVIAGRGGGVFVAMVPEPVHGVVLAGVGFLLWRRRSERS